MKAGFVEKLIGRLGKIDANDVQNYFLRLAQEKGFLETVFNAIQEGIIVSDVNGRITYLNEAACELFGLDSEDSIGKRLDVPVGGWGRSRNRQSAQLTSYSFAVDAAENPRA